MAMLLIMHFPPNRQRARNRVAIQDDFVNSTRVALLGDLQGPGVGGCMRRRIAFNESRPFCIPRMMAVLHDTKLSVGSFR